MTAINTTYDNTRAAAWLAFDDNQGAVFGYGKTLAECEAEAALWTDEPDCLTYLQATEAAYAYAVENGGDALLTKSFVQDVDLVCLRTSV